MRLLLPYLLAMIVLGGLGAGCDQIEEVRTRYRPATPHDQYAEALRTAGLATTALGRDWLTAADAALSAPVDAPLPFREVGYFDPAEAGAIAYALALERGQFLTATAAAPAQVFLDLFEAPDLERGGPARRLASADSTGALGFEVTRTGTYLVRLQPELLRGGRFTLTLAVGPTIVFPVSAHDSRAIRSRFGAPRDGGRRQHHGVDIFAPRGTPTLAAADAMVTRLRNGGLGGKTVWLRDLRTGNHYYYAHLDSQLVEAGMRVAPGDTVGLVGNTGNARTTPPHLHFGIYQRGPHDPYPFVHRPRAEAPTLRADTSRLGTWLRIARDETALRAAPGRQAETRRSLPRHTAVRVLGGTGDFLRIALPDGTLGFVRDREAEASQPPLAAVRLALGHVLREAPHPFATPIDSLRAGDAIAVHARFGAFLHVTAPDGTHGWLPADGLTRTRGW